jgi:hypothetical protein
MTINNGKDFNFYQQITVSGAVFLTEADIRIPIKGVSGFSLFIQSGGTVDYSFNGNTVHGKLILGTSRAFLQFSSRRANQIWLKMASGGGPSVIHVEAWAEI